MNQAVVSKIKVKEEDPEFRFLLRNSLLIKPEAMLCELNLSCEDE